MKPFLIACSAWFAMACPHAAGLDDSLRRLEVPEGAQVESWDGVADRTLVAWIVPGRDDDAHDLHLLVLATGSGEVVARGTFAQAFVGDPRVYGIKLFAADLALAPGKPSFAIDAREEHHGCASNESTVRALYELDGAEIRQLADELFLDSRTVYCTGDERLESHTAFSKAATRHAGHADLVLEEERTTTECDAKGRCRDTGPSRTREVLRFDGQRYVSEAASRPTASASPAAASRRPAPDPGAGAAFAEMRRRFPGRKVDEASVAAGDFDGDGIVDHAALVGARASASPGGALVAVVLGAGTADRVRLVAASKDIPDADGNPPRLAFRRGVLFLDRGASGGCCSRVMESFRFRWRDRGLRLVGLEYAVLANGDRRDDHGQSINLLTGDVVNWTDKGDGRKEQRGKRAPLALQLDEFDYVRAMAQLGPLS